MAKVLYLDNNQNCIDEIEPFFAKKLQEERDTAKKIKLTSHLVVDSTVPDTLTSVINANYDALVLDYRWSPTTTCMDYARKLRKICDKPIIVFTRSADIEVKNRNQDFDDLGFIYVDKVPEDGAETLYTTLQKAINEYKEMNPKKSQIQK